MNDKLIHDFLEGELSSEEKKILFDQLANNSNMKEELDFQMNINKLMELDRSQLNTPSELTNSLFTKLNYNIPNYYKNQPQQPTNNLKNKAILASILLLLLLPTSYLIYDNINPSSNLNTIGQIENQKNNSNSLYNIPDAKALDNSANLNKQNIPITTSNEINQYSYSDNKNKSEINNKLIAKKSKSKKLANKPNNNQNLLSENEITTNYFDLFAVNNISSSNYYQSQKYFFLNYNNIYTKSNKVVQNKDEEFNSEDIFSKVKNKNYELNLYIKNGVQSSPNINLNSPSQLTDNSNISLWYSLNRKLKIGIEYGNESFTQHFYSKGLEYIQQPTLQFVGAGIRYIISDIDLPLETLPYVQFVGGATTIGPIFSLQTGLTVAAYNPITIRLGADFDNLIYQVDSQYYNSSKVNLILGFVYSF